MGKMRHSAQRVTPNSKGEIFATVWFSQDNSLIFTCGHLPTKVWAFASGKELFTLKGHTDYVRWATLSPNGSRIVTGSQDKTLKVWDAKSGAELLTLKLQVDSIDTPIAFSEDGTRIIDRSSYQIVGDFEGESGKQTIASLESTTGTRIIARDNNHLDVSQVWNVWDSRPLNRVIDLAAPANR